jgi:hypothetical protein
MDGSHYRARQELIVGQEGPGALRDWAGQCTGAGEDSAPFEIHIDPERRFLHLVVRGEWDEETFAAYVARYRQAVAILNGLGGVIYVLADTTGYGTLTPEISERMPALVRECNHGPGHRSAVICSSILNKAQAREGCAQLGARFFRNEASAMAWLFSDEA